MEWELERKGTIRAGMKSYFGEIVPDFEEDVQVGRSHEPKPTKGTYFGNYVIFWI